MSMCSRSRCQSGQCLRFKWDPLTQSRRPRIPKFLGVPNDIPLNSGPNRTRRAGNPRRWPDSRTVWNSTRPRFYKTIIGFNRHLGIWQLRTLLPHDEQGGETTHTAEPVLLQVQLYGMQTKLANLQGKQLRHGTSVNFSLGSILKQNWDKRLTYWVGLLHFA